MEKEIDLKKLLAEVDQYAKNLQTITEEDAEMKRCIDFALNEWKTNKRWFREEPGHVTTEDVIKACVTYGWSSRHMYDYTKENKERWEQEKKEKDEKR